MPVTRKFLTELGLTAEQQDAVISAHLGTVNEIKDERDRYKADADKLADVQKRLNDANQKASDLQSKAEDAEKLKAKYDALNAEFEKYKGDVTAKETLSAKQTAYRGLLADANIAEKYREKVLKYADLNGVELDDKGKVKGAAALLRSIREEWPEYVESVTEGSGVQTPNPPANNGAGVRTREDILAIKDAGERQAAIAEELAKGSGLF